MAPAETPSGFLRIAQRDLRAAKGMVDVTLFYEEHWGFQLQQATEKALKAWLIHLGELPPLTHDLNRLLRLLERHEVHTGDFRPLAQLTIYAVQFRYDADPQALGLDRKAFQQQVSQLLQDVELALQQMPGG